MDNTNSRPKCKSDEGVAVTHGIRGVPPLVAVPDGPAYEGETLQSFTPAPEPVAPDLVILPAVNDAESMPHIGERIHLRMNPSETWATGIVTENHQFDQRPIEGFWATFDSGDREGSRAMFYLSEQGKNWRKWS